MITSKSVLGTIQLSEDNFTKSINTSDNPQAILTYIRQHLQDIYGVDGTDKEVKLVLKNLIANASGQLTKEKLLNILRTLL